ncbi:hypothetical protein ACF0H5_009038 [Mactra antiquata]
MTLCNNRFIQKMKKVLTLNYVNLSKIQQSIEFFVQKYFIAQDDGLRRSTNELLNRIENTIVTIEPGVDLRQNKSPLYRGETEMLVNYIRVAENIESYLKAALYIMNN